MKLFSRRGKPINSVGGFHGVITGIANFNGKVLVLTTDGIYEIKSKQPSWYSRLWRWLNRKKPNGEHDDMFMAAALGYFVRHDVK